MPQVFMGEVINMQMGPLMNINCFKLGFVVQWTNWKVYISIGNRKLINALGSKLSPDGQKTFICEAFERKLEGHCAWKYQC